jgi:hypothetical protein
MDREAKVHGTYGALLFDKRWIAKRAENIKKNFNLLSEVTASMFGLTGAGVVFTDAIFSSLAQPPGADVAKFIYWDPNIVVAFEAKKDDQWRYFTECARQNFKSGNVRESFLESCHD